METDWNGMGRNEWNDLEWTRLDWLGLNCGHANQPIGWAIVALTSCVGENGRVGVYCFDWRRVGMECFGMDWNGLD